MFRSRLGSSYVDPLGRQAYALKAWQTDGKADQQATIKLLATHSWINNADDPSSLTTLAEKVSSILDKQDTPQHTSNKTLQELDQHNSFEQSLAEMDDDQLAAETAQLVLRSHVLLSSDDPDTVVKTIGDLNTDEQAVFWQAGKQFSDSRDKLVDMLSNHTEDQRSQIIEQLSTLSDQLANEQISRIEADHQFAELISQQQ